jgi:hypothetical protein
MGRGQKTARTGDFIYKVRGPAWARKIVKIRD